jgi:hypothetical protein
MSHGTTLPSPFIASAGQVPGLIGVAHDTGYASGVPDGPGEPPAPLRIHPAPRLDSDVAATAFQAPCLSDGVDALGHMAHGRALAFRMVQVDALAPGQITGHPMPLFYTDAAWLQSIGQGHPRLGMLGFDEVPVLAFCENAWSETLKAVDSELASRFMRWSYFGHGNTGTPNAPPLAAFFVANPDRFAAQVHRWMPFTRSALLV